MNEISNLQGAWAVGSGVLLGSVIAIIPSWVFGFMGLCCLFSLYHCVRILTEFYCEHQESYRQYCEQRGQPKQPSIEGFHPARGNILNASNLSTNECEVNDLDGWRTKVLVVSHPVKVRYKLTHFFAKIAFGFHKSKDVVKLPNEIS